MNQYATALDSGVIKITSGRNEGHTGISRFTTSV